MKPKRILSVSFKLLSALIAGVLIPCISTGEITVFSVDANGTQGDQIINRTQLGIAFGSVDVVGAPEDKVFRIINATDPAASLTIANLDTPGDGFTVQSQPAQATLDTTGAATDFTIRFDPSARGAFVETLTITDQNGTLLWENSLSGTGVSPEMQVTLVNGGATVNDDSAINFTPNNSTIWAADGGQGTDPPIEILISSIGDGDLNWEAAIEGTHAADYSLDLSLIHI